MTYILFVVGFILLIKGADLLIEGSSALARKFGISSIVIGLTVVAFGTSVPELVINLFSAIQGNTDVALGNIIGSNICNILLILGLTAIIFPLDVKVATAWKEIPFSLFATLLLFILCNDALFDGARESFLSRSDGIIMFSFFGVFLYYVIEMALKHKEDLPITVPEDKFPDMTSDVESQKDEHAKEEEAGDSKSGKKSSEKKEPGGTLIFFMIIGGLAALVFGGKWVVDGAVIIAKKFGMSEFLISATVLAVGSSLPELVTSLVAAYKKEPDITVGNIVGSNIFNIFWILGMTALIRPIPVTVGINVDLIFLMVATLYLFLFMFVGKKYKIERWQGVLMFALYIFYLAYIIIRG